MGSSKDVEAEPYDAISVFADIEAEYKGEGNGKPITDAAELFARAGAEMKEWLLTLERVRTEVSLFFKVEPSVAKSAHWSKQDVYKDSSFTGASSEASFAVSKKANLVSVSPSGITFQCPLCKLNHIIELHEKSDLQRYRDQRNGLSAYCATSALSRIGDTVIVEVQPFDRYTFEFDRAEEIVVALPTSVQNSPTDEVDMLADALGSRLVIESHGPSRSCSSSEIPKGAVMISTHCGPKDSDHDLKFYQCNRATMPCYTVPVTKTIPSKTSGILLREGKAAILAAVSGWSEFFPLEYQLDNSIWAGKSREMCEIIGHTLEPDWRDKGIKGLFNACHVEKQFLSYILFRHTLLGFKDLGKTDSTSGVVPEDLQPLFQQKNVRIHIDRDVCKDCWQCIKKFEAASGVRIVVYVRGRVVNMDQRKL
ncbi:hypothetical protein LTR37_000579 [Vermiconidia calcicola]|uniref:Uncharacterized protein n=1 Tax=Vermiconidia calcicola TaxID=1690605 RepID=A0ACC3NXM0_9PEZI|nr:hypothetical protein LTR37_000579 [Vermiconidia calcicola]